MKFYDCKTAPSPRRARMFIAEKGLDIETVEIDLRSGEQMSDRFRSINPHCTVPVLDLGDGTMLTSTAGIRSYLESAFPEPCLTGRDPVEKGLVADSQWRIETEGMAAMAEALRNTVPAMKGRALTGPVAYEQIPALAERGKARITRFLDRVDTMIGDKPFVAGEHFSVADIDLLVVIDFAGWLKLKLPAEAQNAHRWYAAVSARDSAKL